MAVQESWRIPQPIDSITIVMPSVKIFTHSTSHTRSRTTRSCPRRCRTLPRKSLFFEPLLAHIVCRNRDFYIWIPHRFPERRTPALVRYFLDLITPSTAVQCNTKRLRLMSSLLPSSHNVVRDTFSPFDYFGLHRYI